MYQREAFTIIIESWNYIYNEKISLFILKTILLSFQVFRFSIEPLTSEKKDLEQVWWYCFSLITDLNIENLHDFYFITQRKYVEL